MKLDHEFVRSFLLFVESSKDPLGPSATESINFCKEYLKSIDELGYTEELLFQAGFISEKPGKSTDGYNSVAPGNLTWKGTEYLDNIRDNKIWKKTKNTIFSKVGSASLSIFSSVSAKLIEDQFKP